MSDQDWLSCVQKMTGKLGNDQVLSAGDFCELNRSGAPIEQRLVLTRMSVELRERLDSEARKVPIDGLIKRLRHLDQPGFIEEAQLIRQGVAQLIESIEYWGEKNGRK